ncbi:DUF883 family protein [Oricola thermophila]|uniref:DUF883 family protein n=1 Tax=Oricola thermophila TaxID=2742145 RepID=A0A6N1VH73_9HYPH|nr:DUF883 family protein [Oricola thermophila]QKV19035.1 DUF883 family protein [Oricola thermophila]
MTATTATKSARTSKNGRAGEVELAREVEGLREDLAALTERFSSVSDLGLRTARDFTREKGDEAFRRGEAAYEEISAHASELERKAANSIREHPLQALGIAAGVGFLAALLTRR